MFNDQGAEVLKKLITTMGYAVGKAVPKPGKELQKNKIIQTPVFL